MAGPVSFTYDANGNLTSDGSTTFIYDIENRLVSASGAKTALLVYDPMGGAGQGSVGEADGKPAEGACSKPRARPAPTSSASFMMAMMTKTRTMWGMVRFRSWSPNMTAPAPWPAALLACGHAPHVRVSSLHSTMSTMTKTRTMRGMVCFRHVVQYDGAAVGAAARTFLMPDERGSIAGLFYNDGTSRAKNSYDEYGIPGSTNQGRFQYTGQTWLPELGMYHYKARIYSPTLGRFLQTDPIGYEDQINLFAYVGNDPINGRDPTGLSGCDDMADEGLMAECFDASNFKEKKADANFSIVSNANADAAVAEASPDYAVAGAEKGFRVDGSNVSPAGKPGEVGGTSTVSFTPADIKGADAFGHSHPEDQTATEIRIGAARSPGIDGANPGPGDGNATIEANKPNYITHRGRTIVIEVSGGQARVRVVSGTLTSTEKWIIKERLQSMQRKIQ